MSPRRRADGASATASASTWGALDILVNNVGTNIRKPSLAFTDDEYRTVLDTNLTSAWELTRLLQPSLKASGRAAIVNIGSVAGMRAVGSGAVYAMSKAALAHLTRYLACEWARDGIRVNMVAPWYTRTPLAGPVLGQPDVLAAIVDKTPMGRVARAGRDRRDGRVPVPARRVVRHRAGDCRRRRLLGVRRAVAGLKSSSSFVLLRVEPLEHQRRRCPAEQIGREVQPEVAPGQQPHDGRAHRNGRIERGARHVAHRERARQHREPNGQAEVGVAAGRLCRGDVEDDVGEREGEQELRGKARVSA